MSTRLLLHESNAQLEPYFPLPARFGPWLTWGVALIGIASWAGAAASVLLSQPAPDRYRLGVLELAEHAPARDVLGAGLSLLGFVSYLVSWSVFHSLELRLQGISSMTNLANACAHRLGLLVAAGLFGSGCAMHTSTPLPRTLRLFLGITCALALLEFATVTWLVHANQQRLMRSSRDLLWLRVKKAGVVTGGLLLCVRCAAAAVGAQSRGSRLRALRASPRVACALTVVVRTRCLSYLTPIASFPPPGSCAHASARVQDRVA